VRLGRFRIDATLAACGCIGLMLLPFVASAEPYLAVETGLKCASCHVNPSGGGKRTPFGIAYAKSQIAAHTVTTGKQRKPWIGDLNKWFSIGGNFRGGYDSVDIPTAGSSSEFAVSRTTVYAQVRAVPNLLSIYVDEKLAPGDPLNREAYLLLTPKHGKYTVKAGQFFLPFGLRLQDDNAFVRQTSGVNFNTPDNGLELGLELPKWSAQLAVTDGDAGGGNKPGSNNRLSLSAVYVRPRWRVGASSNLNKDPLGDRAMQSAFAGVRTGPIAWLSEVDFIRDETPIGHRNQYASLLEGNWRMRKGHNLKLTYEYLDPDRNRTGDEQERYSLVWEYSPIQFVQARVGTRAYNGIPNFVTSNRDEWFAEFHVYF
jgi:hypothetical protein